MVKQKVSYESELDEHKQVYVSRHDITQYLSAQYLGTQYLDSMPFGSLGENYEPY